MWIAVSGVGCGWDVDCGCKENWVAVRSAVGEWIAVGK